jgi:hypothetical protein
MILSRGKYKGPTNEIVSKCYSIVKNYQLPKIVNDGGEKDGTINMVPWLMKRNLSTLMPHYWDELKPLIETVEQLTNGNTVTFSWFNILPYGSSLGEHRHLKPNHSVFIYYPKCSDASSAFEFYENGSWISVQVETGDWIQVKNHVLHRVPKNYGEDRISIAFNA